MWRDIGQEGRDLLIREGKRSKQKAKDEAEQNAKAEEEQEAKVHSLFFKVTEEEAGEKGAFSHSTVFISLDKFLMRVTNCLSR